VGKIGAGSVSAFCYGKNPNLIRIENQKDFSGLGKKFCIGLDPESFLCQ
jgi:hypothetical protein